MFIFITPMWAIKNGNYLWVHPLNWKPRQPVTSTWTDIQYQWKTHTPTCKPNKIPTKWKLICNFNKTQMVLAFELLKTRVLWHCIACKKGYGFLLEISLQGNIYCLAMYRHSVKIHSYGVLEAKNCVPIYATATSISGTAEYRPQID